MKVEAQMASELCKFEQRFCSLNDYTQYFSKKLLIFTKKTPKIHLFRTIPMGGKPQVDPKIVRIWAKPSGGPL